MKPMTIAKRPEELDALSRFEGEGGHAGPVAKAESDAPAGVVSQGRFRRLKWHELVRVGDFVLNDQRRFELWEGPTGFRADAFVKTIYRTGASRSATKKEK